MRASVIGYMKDLHTLKADDLRAWYKQYYAPNNAVLVIVGDVDAKQTLQTAAKLFGDIPAKAQPPRNKLNTEPYLRKPVTVKATSPVTHQPLIAINFRVPKLQKLDDTMPSPSTSSPIFWQATRPAVLTKTSCAASKPH